MLKSIFAKREQESVYDLVYFFGICLLLIALPTSIYFVSASQLLMGLNWLVEGRYREKLQRFWNNRPAVLFSAIYLVYLAGILWTQDLAQGVGSDLKNKVPILTLPFLLASIRPLPPERTRLLPLLFSLSVMVATFVGFSFYLTQEFADPRAFSPFVIHVFFSMMVVFAIFLLPWSVRRITQKTGWFYLSLAGAAWLLVFLFTLSALTGILCLGAVVVYLLAKEMFFKPGIHRKLIGTLVLAGVVALVVFVLGTVMRPLSREVDPDPGTLTQTTREGNPYLHDFEETSRENGHLVYFFIAEDELREAWNARSELNIDSASLAGQELKATILRYLSSKGLRKDRQGLNALDDHEIRAIEYGVPNHLYLQWPNFLVRVHQTLWEIQELERTGNPGGHSLTTRVELWEAAWTVFRLRPIFGWGTGDVLGAVQYGLKLTESELDYSRLKTHPHNQYLHLLVMLGLAGTILIGTLYYQFISRSFATRFEIFKIFLVIALAGMLVDSPVDHQIGLTFLLAFSLYFGVLERHQSTNREPWFS
jgi:hypothetical protein